MKRILLSLFILGITLSSLFSVATAVLQESVGINGASFTVGTGTSSGGSGTTPTGNTSLKMLIDLSGSTADSNLSDNINGPEFTNIGPDWLYELPVKVYNKGSGNLSLVASASYVNDPDVLRDDIFVKITEWNDQNNNGVVEQGEEGQILGYDTVLRLRNDTYNLGQIDPSQTRGYIFEFDGTGVSEANAGMSAVYDFLITGTGQ